jgi:hypothetical protein
VSIRTRGGPELSGRRWSAGEERPGHHNCEIDAEAAFRAKIPFALFSGGHLREPVEAFEPMNVFDHFEDFPDCMARSVARR